MNTIGIIGCVAGAGALVGLSYANYRRFMPAARPLNDKHYKVRIEKHHIKKGDKDIYGELLLPEGVAGRLPTVICCHGYGSSYKLTKSIVGKPFAMSGYAAFCFDFCGGSPKSKSLGSFHDMTIFKEREDLLDVIEYVKRLPSTDASRLYLLGESQGGMVAGITAPRVAEDIRAMVLYYPAFCIPFDAREKFPSREAIPDEVEAFNLKIGGEYYRSTYDFDVYGEIAGYKKPVLIMHGDRDETVPHKYGQQGATAYENARFETFPGEIHGWYGKGKRKAAEHSYNFFEEN